MTIQNSIPSKWPWRSLAVVIILYLVPALLSGTSYPSVRFARPIPIGKNILVNDNGDVFNGTYSELGWPLRCLGLREEAESPRRINFYSRQRIVATRISWRATFLNLTFAVGSWFLLIAFFSLSGSPQRVRQGLVAGGLGLIAMGCVVSFSQQRFRNDIYISPYPEKQEQSQ